MCRGYTQESIHYKYVFETYGYTGFLKNPEGIQRCDVAKINFWMSIVSKQYYFIRKTHNNNKRN